MSPEDRKKLDVWPGPIYLPYKPKYQAFSEVVMLLITSPDSRYRPFHYPIVIYFSNACSLGCT